MLKTTYNAESEIPENLKGAYVQKDGKWALDQLSEDHPVVSHNKELLTDKTKATNKTAELQADLDAAKGSSVPRGYVAVTKTDSELLEKVKAHGSGDEVVTKLTEYKSLKEETDKRKREDQLRLVAKELNYEPEAFVRLQNLPEFEIRDGADGKKSVIAKLKGVDGVITEKPAQEVIESSADLAPFLPALKAQGNGGVKVHGSRSTNGEQSKDVFQKIRDNAKKENEQQVADVHPMFKKLPGRTAAQTGE